jgi:hypothetical protein
MPNLLNGSPIRVKANPDAVAVLKLEEILNRKPRISWQAQPTNDAWQLRPGNSIGD